ncbi:uncharacterized protein AC631_00348 [Debaryomyces fabryi]|uniref:Major facilitator superfamily (MFS) profile domain-containing protein n=1 Tax=Debaryomyces fabryi TaxID=58627 RepID=A0A0V1Q6H2_9ASCO|nr:uncharacterized protein AC631_00348 [Debaryomyces fabryi]KSA03893.1 hypothetical protein AC631_00348 [Debaryomyces fabryi]CUM48765.1 unnamed protein product [Debaryomyces fabryi]
MSKTECMVESTTGFNGEDVSLRSLTKEGKLFNNIAGNGDVKTGTRSTAYDTGEEISQIIHRPKYKLKKSELSTNESTALMYASEANPDDFPDGGLAAYLVLFGSFMGLIADFGIANSLGAIQSYVTSHQLENVSESTASWVFSMHLGVMYFGNVIFGSLFDKFGARKLLIAGTIVMCGGLFCTAESTTVVQFILSFGITTAIGTSLAMPALIAVVTHWFLRRRAMACLIATIGGLVGASCIAVMLQNLYVEVGFKWAIRILSFFCMACMCVSIIFVKERKSEPSLQNGLTDVQIHTDTETSKNHKIAYRVTQFFDGIFDFSMFKDIRFILLTMAVFFSEIVSLSTLTYLTSYAIAYDVSDSSAYLLITLVNVCGIPARLVLGIIADYYGRFNVMVASSILTTITIFGLWLPAKGNMSLLYAFSILFGVVTSANISLIGPTIGQITSAEKFGQCYGMCYFCLSFLTILGMLFSSLVIGSGTLVEYRNFIFYEGGISIGSVIFWILARYSGVGWNWCKF